MRIALLLLCLAASTTQNWVAQLHVHGDPVAAASLAAPAEVAQAHPAGSDSAPGYPGHTEGQCLLCQVASQGAAILLFAATAGPIVAPLDFVRRPAADPARVDYDSRSHHWSSRGPPRA